MIEPGHFAVRHEPPPPGDMYPPCATGDGFWIFGKKRMIPAGVVQGVDAEAKHVFVTMTKDQIKNAPDYDADRHAADEKGYHKEVGDYYEPHAS